jgi:hypothetical protein
MIRYRYNDQHDPPAPFVYVTLGCPTTGNRAANLPAQVDTAADSDRAARSCGGSAGPG